MVMFHIQNVSQKVSSMSGWPSPGLATDAARLCGCQVAAAAAQCLGAHEGAKRREAARSGAGSDWRGFATSKDRGFHRHGGTPKWMVLRGNPIKMDDLGVPLYGNTQIGTQEKQTTCSECLVMKIFDC